MSRILRVAFLFNFAGMCAASALLASLGLDYMDPEIGHGLHPVFAFAGVAICSCLALICLQVATTPQR